MAGVNDGQLQWRCRRVWDSPLANGGTRGGWSDDGVLCVASRESLHLFCPTFDHTAFYARAWVQILEPDDDSASSGVSGKRKSPLSANDLLLWVAQAGPKDGGDATVQFECTAWGPPGACAGTPALLAVLFSTGALAIFEQFSDGSPEKLRACGALMEVGAGWGLPSSLAFLVNVGANALHRHCTRHDMLPTPCHLSCAGARAGRGVRRGGRL